MPIVLFKKMMKDAPIWVYMLGGIAFCAIFVTMGLMLGNPDWRCLALGVASGVGTLWWVLLIIRGGGGMRTLVMSPRQVHAAAKQTVQDRADKIAKQSPLLADQMRHEADSLQPPDPRGKGEKIAVLCILVALLGAIAGVAVWFAKQ